MSDAEKARIFDRLVELLRDRLSLEKHYRDMNMGRSTIDVVRVDDPSRRGRVNLTAAGWRQGDFAA